MADPPSGFQDEYDDLLKDVSGMSDADLERLMGGSGPPVEDALPVETLETGTRVAGTVVEVREDEVLVELDGKNLGIIDLAEFDVGNVPRPGSEIQAEFVRYDRDKEVSVLSTQTVRTEVFWEELKIGTVLVGTVVETNKGGLTLDIKGARAFLPISQIEMHRVEDLEPYIGRRLNCEITQFDRHERNLVVSRRRLLEEEAAETKARRLESLSEGDVLRGTVTRMSDHGAFVDLGGVDGLLHMSKIHQNIKKMKRKSENTEGTADPEREPLREGQTVTVQITSIDRDRGRIGLDVHHLEEDAWDRTIESYSVGDAVTGWVSRVEEERAIVKIDEGLEAIIPNEFLSSLELPGAGSILRGRIVTIDRAKREIRLKPLPED